MQTSREIRVLLFDLGGVLLNLRDPIATFGLQISKAEFKVQWLQSPSVCKFESGAIDAEEFAKSIVAEAELPYDWREFLERFDSWPNRLFDQTLSVLQAIPPSYRCALLSNINALHWEREDIAGPLAGCFDRLFLSYQTGFTKPDREAYELVVKTYGCQPDEVLFFEDSPTNVAAAADFGIQAVLAAGIDEVRETLQQRGILAQGNCPP